MLLKPNSVNEIGIKKLKFLFLLPSTKLKTKKIVLIPNCVIKNRNLASDSVKFC